MAFEQMSLQWNFRYIYMFWPVGDLFQDSEQEFKKQGGILLC